MPHEQLKLSLQQLQQQLASGEPLDPETKATLEELTSNVNELLKSQPETSSETNLIAAGTEQQSVLDRLLNLTEEFEESHPRLAETIGKMAAALGQIGI